VSTLAKAGEQRRQSPGYPVMPPTVRVRFFMAGSRKRNYSGLVLDLSSLDLAEIGNALSDQADDEHLWLISPQTGEIAFWTAGTDIDGQTPVDPGDLDLVCIDPLPSWVWYQDMADFAETITDERAGRRLARAIQGKGAFRRFKEELDPDGWLL
jgi:hypothetical protein